MGQVAERGDWRVIDGECVYSIYAAKSFGPENGMPGAFRPLPMFCLSVDGSIIWLGWTCDVEFLHACLPVPTPKF